MKMKYENLLINRITSWNPESRRLWAVRMLLWSLVLGVVNVALYVTGVISVNDLILITLVLSWLAITITALDVVATTDVRTEQE